ncbi:MAG: glycosyltransferase [Silvibacterium sp.]|nr:glycosyltransferase [Silvibacterium sp.]
MPHPEPIVTACIPYYAGKRYIRRAVESLLAQTCRDLRVIVVNDGDAEGPWDQLRSLRDPRLVGFNLSRNHGGPFFANAVVVDAIESPWFLVQEQDDWSDPRRVAYLLELTRGGAVDVAVSAQFFHREDNYGRSTPVGIRWRHVGHAKCPACPPGAECEECFVDTGLTARYRYRAPHAGLFNTRLLRRIGGYYIGLNLHYDSLLLNLLLMTGTIAHSPFPLYHRVLRADSITHAAHTGFGSQPSNEERRAVFDLYERSFREYQRYLRGELNSEGLAEAIRHRGHGRLGAQQRSELAFETNRLRAHLEQCRWHN